MAEARNTSSLWLRYADERGHTREAILSKDELYEAPAGSLSEWLQTTVGRVEAALTDIHGDTPAARASIASVASWRAPLDEQEVWGAGVTYQRSREARQEEAQDGGDVYERVYEAKRPEIFYKGNARNVVGHGGEVGIRADSDWDVPEPELALLFNPALEVVGFTIGLDMSSRSIEGENPLYLPQAKVFNASCALGPGVLLMAADEWPFFRISMTIERKRHVVFAGETNTDKLARSLPELAGYLGRSNDFPQGVFLLTGTGIVPPADFTLQIGDHIRTEISDIGALENTVILV